MKNGYSERTLGISCVVERLHSGFFRVITEDGRDDLVKQVGAQRFDVGDVGRTVYYSNGNSYGLVKFVKDPTVGIDFEKVRKNYPYEWKDEWPSGLSRDAEALFEIFKEEYVKRGCMYSGMIPLNAPPICGYQVRALYELVSAGVLQKRDCDADAFELTAQERLKLIDTYNLQDAWKESGLAEWCEDEVTRVMCMVGESSLGDRLADAQKKSEQLADSAKAINLDEYELMPSRVDGFEIYRKILRDENGNRVKGIWVAAKDGKEPFHISYEQALGREPIEDSSIKRLARQLGEMLLP